MYLSKLKRHFLNVLPYTIVVLTGILFYFFLLHAGAAWGVVTKVAHVMSPLFIGFVVAYLLNRPVMFFDRLFSKADKKGRHKKACRRCAVALVYALLLAFFSLFISIIIPQIAQSIRQLVGSLGSYASRISDFAAQYLPDLNFAKRIEEALSGDWINLLSTVGVKALSSIDYIAEITSGITGTIVNFFVGLVFAVYMNASKERFVGYVNKVVDAFCSDGFARRLREVGALADKNFSGFITGKIIDSLIISVLCWVATTILRIPYALLVSVIVGITNIIPVFGPFIGAIPSAFIILMASPSKCLIFIILIIVIQQLDGNLIGPHILGDSMGLDSFWILAAIILGGGLWGILGMVIGVPLFAVLLVLLRTYINDRLDKKREKPNEEI